MHVYSWKVEVDFETTEDVFLALNLKNGLAKSIFFNFQFESFPLPVKNLTWRRWFHSSLRPITKAVFSPRCKQFVTNSLRSNFKIVLGLRRPRPLDLSFSDLQRRDFPHLHYSEHYCRVCVSCTTTINWGTTSWGANGSKNDPSCKIHSTDCYLR